MVEILKYVVEEQCGAGDALLLRGRGLDTPGMEVTVAGRPCSSIGRQRFGRLMCYGMAWTPTEASEYYGSPGAVIETLHFEPKTWA